MHNDAIARRLLAEGLGSTLLAATVVGSGVMAERLSGGNTGIALLANTAATVAVLAALIALLGPISGAHFNPAVSVIEAKRGRLSWVDAGLYSAIQTLGCCAGAWLAHLMFELPLWQLSAHVRTGPAQWVAEGVATFGLLLVVIGHRLAGVNYFFRRRQLFLPVLSLHHWSTIAHSDAKSVRSSGSEISARFRS